jgi:hypothetical protein
MPGVVEKLRAEGGRGSPLGAMPGRATPSKVPPRGRSAGRGSAAGRSERAGMPIIVAPKGWVVGRGSSARIWTLTGAKPSVVCAREGTAPGAFSGAADAPPGAACVATGSSGAMPTIVFARAARPPGRGASWFGESSCSRGGGRGVVVRSRVSTWIVWAPGRARPGERSGGVTAGSVEGARLGCAAR